MSTSPALRNLELKVQCRAGDLPALRERLLRHVCAPIDRLQQVDTYFRVERGRLKVRELRSAVDPDLTERGELIAYARANDAGSRWSRYEVIPVAGGEVAALLRGLALTHDELARVEKVREVGLIGHTRVHLDDVVGLGAFCELETVLAGQDDAMARSEHQQVIAALELDRYPVVGGSYSDLIIGQAAGK